MKNPLLVDIINKPTLLRVCDTEYIFSDLLKQACENSELYKKYLQVISNIKPAYMYALSIASTESIFPYGKIFKSLKNGYPNVPNFEHGAVTLDGAIAQLNGLVSAGVFSKSESESERQVKIFMFNMSENMNADDYRALIKILTGDVPDEHKYATHMHKLYKENELPSLIAMKYLFYYTEDNLIRYELPEDLFVNDENSEDIYILPQEYRIKYLSIVNGVIYLLDDDMEKNIITKENKLFSKVAMLSTSSHRYSMYLVANFDDQSIIPLYDFKLNKILFKEFIKTTEQTFISQYIKNNDNVIISKRVTQPFIQIKNEVYETDISSYTVNKFPFGTLSLLSCETINGKIDVFIQLSDVDNFVKSNPTKLRYIKYKENNYAIFS